MEKDEVNNKMSVIMTLNVLLVSFTIIIVLIVAGYLSWPFFPTIFIGAAIQTVFRVTKRYFRNKEKYLHEIDGQYLGKESKGGSFDIAIVQVYSTIFSIMLVVCTIWYGVGALIEYIFGSAH